MGNNSLPQHRCVGGDLNHTPRSSGPVISSKGERVFFPFYRERFSASRSFNKRERRL